MSEGNDFTTYTLIIDKTPYPDARIVGMDNTFTEVPGEVWRSFIPDPMPTYTLQIGNATLECRPSLIDINDTRKEVRLYGVFRTYPTLTPWQRVYAEHIGYNADMAQYDWDYIEASGAPEIYAFKAGYEAAEAALRPILEARAKRIEELTEKLDMWEAEEDEDEDEGSHEEILSLDPLSAHLDMLDARLSRLELEAGISSKKARLA